MSSTPDRCRIILLADPSLTDADTLCECLDAGDVAGILLYREKADERQFETFCKSVAQKLSDGQAAILIADDTKLVGRAGADGVVLIQDRNSLEHVIARFSPHKIVGCGGIRDRHNALEAGEKKPDFVFFGTPGGDIKPEPHSKNLALASWWSEMIEIPCICLAGTDVEGIVEVAATGADFVAIGRGVFDGPEKPQIMVERANRLLEEHAPVFGT